MPRKIEGDGVIQVVCSRCGFTYHEYVIGSSNNKSKYIGPPTPAKAISGFDGRRCPICGKPASVERPLKVLIFTEREYRERVRHVDIAAGVGIIMRFTIVDGIDEIFALQVKRAVEESARTMYPLASPHDDTLYGVGEAVDEVAVGEA